MGQKVVKLAFFFNHYRMTIKLDNYRSSREYREILRILQKASSLQENFLWQSHPYGKSIVPIQHFEIDFVSREVVIYFNPDTYSIDVNLPLYLKLDYRTSVFKVTEYRLGTNTLHFGFPEEIKTQELRSHLRHHPSNKEQSFVHLKPATGGVRSEGVGEIKVRAMDISYYGLGLIISEQNRSFFKNNRILWVTQLNNMRLQHPILAEVVYINTEVEPRMRSNKQKELKVGLKISGVFPEKVFNTFIQ